MQDRNSDKPIFSTIDTSLSACLLMSGFELIDVDIKSRQSVFLWEDCEELRIKKKEFELYKAIGNLRQYFEAYRKCLMMAKNGKM